MKFKYQQLLCISSMFCFSHAAIAVDQHFLRNTPFSVPTVKQIPSALGLNDAYTFNVVNRVVLPNGKIKNRFVQYYHQIPVWGVSLAATESGSLVDFSGSYLKNIETDLQLTKVKWTPEQSFAVALKQAAVSSSSVIDNKQIQTIITQAGDHKAHLVYQISFFVDDGKKPRRPYFMIDAQNGKVLHHWEGLTTRDGFGPGGNEKIGQYYYGRDYPVLDVTENCEMNSANVWTFDMQNKISDEILFKFTCPENTYKFTNGAFSPLNDAHYFGNVVYNMYYDWFNTPPVTMKLKMRVHYSTNYENAFWDGKQMTFGDGLDKFYPLVALDVTSHEISHGFTEQNSGLVYELQSGGINEAFSDIAGEAAEYYNNKDKPEDQRNDWLEGAAITKKTTALRYFANPPLDGHSIGHAKDYYNGLNVHYSSGVFNKGFYTLAKKIGWNTEKAFRAFVLANQVYWTPMSDFNDAACGVKQAARDLGYSEKDIVDSFNVVGVNAACAIDVPPTSRELQNGVPISTLTGDFDSETFFRINVPANQNNLTVKISGDPNMGDADLYVLYKDVPTINKYDCRPYLDGSNETCTFTKPGSGLYYIMLKGHSMYTNITLLATFS